MGHWDSHAQPVAGDSFRIANTSGNFPPPEKGKCLGMSSYAKWFYENRAGSSGPLFPHFTDSQQIQIARQAQNDCGQVLAGFTTLALPRSGYQVAEDLIAKLDTENNPQILCMTKTPMLPSWTGSFLLNLIMMAFWGDAHAVLVVGYDESGTSGTFKIYNNWDCSDLSYSSLTYSQSYLHDFVDPNYPSDSAGYVDFQNYASSYFYNSTTFTSANYPAP